MKDGTRSPWNAYIDTGGQCQIVGEVEVEAEVIEVWIESTLSTEDELLLEQSGEAVAMVLRDPPLALAACESTICVAHAGFWLGCAFGDLNVSIEANDDVCDAERLCDIEDDLSTDGITRTVDPQRLVELDVVIENVIGL